MTETAEARWKAAQEKEKNMTKSFEERVWEKVDIPHGGFGCWEWDASRTSQGYGRFSLDKKMVLVHRLIYEMVNGPIPDGLCVCHHCDNPPCVNPSHLFIGTNADNVRDRDEKGRTSSRKGSDNTQAKLTEGNVKDIRTRLTEGETTASVARMFGVSQRNIRKIGNHKVWTHVQ